MPTNVLVRAIFTSASPLVDNVSMDLSYTTTSSTALVSDVSQLLTFVGASFSLLPTGSTHPAAYYIGPVIPSTANNNLLQAYDLTGHLDGSPHGSPIAIGNFTLSGTRSAASLPEGVCSVITLQAAYGTDVEFAPGARPRARDRGRIYFGPICGQMVTTDASLRTIIIAAGAQDVLRWLKSIFSFTSPGGPTFQLGVWSRRNQIVKPLVGAYMDDRPDYQRRRTDQSGTRYSVTLP